MRRILALIVVLVLLAWGACAVRRSLASDETKIRWMIEAAVEGFNDGKTGSALAPLSDDWRDRAAGLQKNTLHQILVAAVFQEKDPTNNEFALELIVPPELLVIVVAEDDVATATMQARFSRKRGPERTSLWIISIEADLRVGEDGWEVWRTNHTSLEGRGF